MGQFKKALLLFIFINFSLYLYIWKFAALVPFRTGNYLYSAHHYLQDERIGTGGFNLLRALGQYDAQWYLRIADNGYPFHPSNINMEDKTVMDGLTYAFFPLYPLILSILNIFFGYIELSAFVFSIILLLADFYSLYFVVTNLYSEKIANYSVLLLFLFPFSIFYRSYFTEGIFLFLLIWYSYFLIKRNWTKASLFQGLLLVTRPTGLFLLPLTFYYLLSDLYRKKFNPSKLFIYMPLIFGFFCLWLLFNLKMTGSIFYWKNVQLEWITTQSIPKILYYNYLLLKNFFILPLHDIHASKIDIMTFFVFGWILYFSLDRLKKELWWTSFLMWIVPLLLKDTASYTRYQIISFPIFIYLATVLNRRQFAILSSVFYSLLLLLSLYFVNWNWFG